MKNIKRVLSFALVLILATSLFCIPGLAATDNMYPQYNNYMCVGDSIAAGCGLTKDGSDTYFDQSTGSYAYVYNDNYIYLGHDYSPVPNAYHTIVADALDANLLQCARSGMRAVEFRYWLDGVYNDYDETRSWDNTYFDVDGNGFTLEDLDLFNTFVNYPDKVRKADIISINVGSNDIFSVTFGVALGSLSTGSSNPQLDAIKAYFESTGNVGATLGKLIDLYESTGKIADLISAISDSLSKTYKQYIANYDAIMKRIYQINPDITVVTVGVFNPLRYVSLSADSKLDISPLANGIVNQINNYLKAYGTKYKNCYYADVTDTETYPMSYSDNLFWEYFTLKVHPTISGHKYMAKQILNAIPKGMPFTDVKTGDWCYNDVLYCYENGLMNGTSSTKFSPNSTMTRGMVATVLYRIAGSPNVSYLREPFSDVNGGNYYNGIIWAYNNGIIKGYDNGTFKPNNLITREQFATMLYRYAIEYGYAKDTMVNQVALLGFNDAPSISGYAKNAVGWAVANGIMQGKGANTIVPKGNASRAQCATMLARFDRLIEA